MGEDFRKPGSEEKESITIPLRIRISSFSRLSLKPLVFAIILVLSGFWIWQHPELPSRVYTNLEHASKKAVIISGALLHQTFLEVQVVDIKVVFAPIQQFLEMGPLAVGKQVGSWFSEKGGELVERSSSITKRFIGFSFELPNLPSFDLFSQKKEMLTPEESPEIVVKEVEDEIRQLADQGLAPSPIPPVPTLVERVIIERTIERIISGLSQQELDLAIQALNNKFLNEIAQLKDLVSQRSNANFQAIALTNKIDSLSSVTLTSATVSGVSGLTDADIPDGITINTSEDASFPNLTASGNLTVDTNTLFVDAATNRVGIGTTTPNWNLQVAGTRPFITLSDTSAGLDDKHWFLSSQGGNFYIGTSTDAFSATTTYLTIINNGNVGIGTTSPTALLHIGASTAARSSLRIQSGTAPSSLQVGDIFSDGTDLFFYDGVASRDLTIQATAGAGGWTDDGSVVRLTTASDKVGIGTTSPTTKLYIEDSAGLFLTLHSSGSTVDQRRYRFEAGSIDLRLRAINDADVNQRDIITFQHAGNVGIGTTSPWGILSVTGNGTDHGFVVEDSSNVPDFLIAANGRVAINSETTTANATTTPMAALSIVGGDNTVFIATTNVAPEPDVVQFMLRNNGGITELGTFRNNGQLAIFSGGSEAMRIDSSGNVGIGTTSPINKLSVVSTNGITVTFNNPSTAGTMELVPSNGSTRPNELKWYGSDNFAIANDTNLGNAGKGFVGNQRFVITTTGNVGIGTTTPWGVLSVESTANPIVVFSDAANDKSPFIIDGSGSVAIGTTTINNTQKLTIVTSDTATGVVFGTNSGTIRLQNIDNTANNFTSITNMNSRGVLSSEIVFINVNHNQTNTTGEIAFVTRNEGTTHEVMRMDKDGNVGIGATSPDTVLHIVNNNANKGLILERTSATIGKYDLGITSDGNFQIGEFGVSSRLTIEKTSGNVGIGDTSPDFLFHVENAGTATTTRFSRGGNFMDFGGAGSGTQFIGVFEGNFAIYNTFASGNLKLGAGGKSDVMVITSSKNVGIGTTIVDQKLHLEDSTANADVLVATENDVRQWNFGVRGGSADSFIIRDSTAALDRFTINTNGNLFTGGLRNAGGAFNSVCFDSTTKEIIWNGTDICTSSSLRYKENIETLAYGLKEVLELSPVSFQFKEEFDADQRYRIGFIAEDVALIIPEVIGYDAEGRVDTVNYPNLTALLTNAIQEQQEQIEAIKAVSGGWQIANDGTLKVKKILSDEVIAGQVVAEEIITKEGNVDVRIKELEARISKLEILNGDQSSTDSYSIHTSASTQDTPVSDTPTLIPDTAMTTPETPSSTSTPDTSITAPDAILDTSSTTSDNLPSTTATTSNLEQTVDATADRTAKEPVVEEPTQAEIPEELQGQLDTATSTSLE